VNALLEIPGKDRRFGRVARRRRNGFSLNIEPVLRKSRETNIIEARKRKIEKLGFTEWGIWKLLHIQWG
jgi:hypothetical protein